MILTWKFGARQNVEFPTFSRSPKEQVPGNQLQLMGDDGAESEPENAEPAHRDVAPREQQIETDNLPVPSDPDVGEGHASQSQGTQRESEDLQAILWKISLFLTRGKCYEEGMM